ncbi:MAG TPA: twin-arginine translocase TatA/TatE family subunit [Candidatus Sulfobium mesophilum]|jgi:sec-independent protein translocase protein TatA|nr:twin-arginine translocase TatA/TatE family subunit [Candidatus Sulfobium mesophilum]
MLRGLFQPMHLLIILGIALVIFGPGKLPELGAGLGKAIREFKKSFSETDKELIEGREAKKEDSTPSENKTA